MLNLSNGLLVDFKKTRIINCSIGIMNGIFHYIIPGSKKLSVNCQELNLKGSYVIPGFTDSHTHLLAHGIEKQRVDLSVCRSSDECLEKLSENKEDQQVFGVNWDESGWRKGRRDDLDKNVLDRISRIKPVIMRRICGHFAICNTKALELISQEWQVVDRKKGYLYEDAALYLNRIFKPSDEMFCRGLKIAMQEANSFGITSIHEITDEQGFFIYQRMRERLTLRVALYRQPENQRKSSDPISINKFGDEFLKVIGIKVFMDGSIGARTAAFRRPYRGTKNHGMLLVSEKDLVSLIKNAERASIQLMIHSIGDRATAVALNAFEKLGRKENRLRHRLEHLELLTKEQIREIAQYRIIASMQPNFIRWQEPGGMYEKCVGQRHRRMNCFKNVKNAHVRVIFGSDCMPLGPLNGIRSALRHPFPCGKLEPGEAFRFYTEEPPYATFDENKKGRIEPGQFADLVVFDKNPLDKRNIDHLRILRVLVAGKTVYRA